MSAAQLKDPNHLTEPPETIPLRAGHPPGYCLQRSLFFASENWINVLHPDIEALLDAFSETWKEEAGGRESPFEVFKGLWEEMGWRRIHLLGMLDGPMRRPWGESVLRGFLEHLRHDEAPLRQVAAFFAIYTFWATQALTQEKVHIHVDPPALEHILTIPAVLALSLSPASATAGASGLADLEIDNANLDPSLANLDMSNVDPSLAGVAGPSNPKKHPSTSTSAPHPALDLSVVLHSLITRNAFFVIPSQSYLFPPVPSVSVHDSKQRNLHETAKLLLGAEEEMNALRNAHFSFLLPDPPQDGNGHSPDVEVDELNDDDGWDDSKGWHAGLRETERTYLTTKRTAFPRQGRTVMTATLMSTAEDLTLRALKDAGSAAEGVVPGIAELESTTSGEARKRKLNLFGLVGKEAKGTVAGEKGLDVFERAIKGVGEVRNAVMEK